MRSFLIQTIFIGYQIQIHKRFFVAKIFKIKSLFPFLNPKHRTVFKFCLYDCLVCLNHLKLLDLNHRLTPQRAQKGPCPILLFFLQAAASRTLEYTMIYTLFFSLCSSLPKTSNQPLCFLLRQVPKTEQKLLNMHQNIEHQ